MSEEKSYDLKKSSEDKKEKIQLKDFPQRCVMCDATEKLVLHHKRYGENLTKNDFVVDILLLFLRLGYSQAVTMQRIQTESRG